MGDISRGPVSSLSGTLHSMPEDSMCDEHPKRKAVARVQGETDSFGCEYEDVCRQCLKEIRAYRDSAEAKTGMCDWCKREATDLSDRRDVDEGLAGRVYRVCGACVKRDNERLEEEAREFGYYDDDWIEPDDDTYAAESIDMEDDWITPPPKKIPVSCKVCSGPWAPGHQCKRRARATS